MVLSLNMEALLSSSATTSATASAAVPPPLAKPPQNIHPKYGPPRKVPFPAKTTNRNLLFPISCFSSSVPKSAAISTASTFPLGKFSTIYDNRCWMVLMEAPPQELVNAKSQIIDYYVSKLERVLGSEKEAQMCIYDASCDTHFGFCCDIDHEAACELASMPGVLSVKPDPDFDSTHKDYSFSKSESVTKSGPVHGTTLLFPTGTTKHWLVRMERPPIGVTRRAQVVDYYVQLLMRVLRNEKDAQMCLYHISWQSNYGFCCELDDNCAQELAGIPSVLSVEPDENFGSDDKGYGGENSRGDKDSSASSLTSNIKTKKLFVTGLSFYTSEKTLRAAFEGFGELVEVKIIMDKISKRSKGYGFLEYTTEEAASTALREMNGKIINGWMITVDVAKKNPPKFTRVQPR